MYIRDIFEGRRNPELNSELRSRQVAKTIEPFFFRKDAYLSMVNLPKVGVNPTSPFHSTPSGIYAYPLCEQIIVSNFLNDNLPHATYEKFVAVLMMNPQARVLSSEYPESHYAEESVALDEIMVNKFSADYWNTVVEQAKGSAEQDNHNLYQKIRYAAVLLTVAKTLPPKIVMGQLLGDQLEMYLWKQNNSKPRIWNGLLRRIGFDAIEDLGTSMIHNAEPFQTCFLSTSAIASHEIFKNGRSSLYGQGKELQSAGQLIKLIASEKIEVFAALEMIAMIFNKMGLPKSDIISSYDRSITFTDAQIKTIVDWAKKNNRERFENWLDDASTIRLVRNSRLKNILYGG